MQDLKDKVAVVFAASGEIAGAVAKSFAQHGAKVYVTARNEDAVKALAREINANASRAGIDKEASRAEIAETKQASHTETSPAKPNPAEAIKVDAQNESEIENVIKKIVADNGKLDIVFNGIGASYEEMGGRPPTTQATFEQFMAPMEKIVGSQFLTSRVAAKYMIQTRSEGTILLLTAALSKSKFPNLAGITAASCAVEGLTRVMAAEFGPQGIKVTCICAGAIMETKRISGWIDAASKQYGIPVEQMVAQYKAADILPTSPTLKQLGETAAFLVSEAGTVLNSHIVDVDCGKTNIL